MKMKKLLVMLLALSMTAGLAACGGSSSTASTEAAGTETAGTEDGSEAEASGTPVSSKDTIVFAEDALPTTMDPYADTNTGTNVCLDLIYDTLWKLENDGTYTARLATEWEWTDETHLAITLREGVTFSNGNAFTSDDVIYTLEHAKDSALTSDFAKVNLDNTTAEDDTHITIAFTEVDPTFMIYMGSQAAGSIMDRETCEADETAITTNSIGTGRYVMTSWVAGDSIKFSKNESYWGDDPALIANVTVREIAEATQRAIELQSGGIDYALTVDPLDIDTFANDENFTVISEPSTMVHSVFFNQNRACGDENVRKAIAYCINKQDIVDSVFSGVGKPANSSVSPVDIGFAEDLGGEEMYTQDIEKAKELLAEAGYADGLELKAICCEGTFPKELEIIKNELAQAGINLTIETYDFTTSLTYALDKSGDWDFFMLANGANTAVVQLSWYDRNQGAPFAQIPDEGLFEILDKMYLTTDSDEQNTLATQAQQYQMEHVLLLPTVVVNQVIAYDADLQNVEPDVDQVPDMSQVYFK